MAIEEIQNEARRTCHGSATVMKRVAPASGAADAAAREVAVPCPLAGFLMVDRGMRVALVTNGPFGRTESVPGRAEGLGSRLHTYWSPRPKELTS